MFAFRKFVGYTGAAAGLGAAIALAMTSQPGLAAAPASPVDQPVTSQLTLSADCTAAINAIKTAVRADVTADNAERMAARTNPGTADTSEDTPERANFEALFQRRTHGVCSGDRNKRGIRAKGVNLHSLGGMHGRDPGAEGGIRAGPADNRRGVDAHPDACAGGSGRVRVELD